MRSAIRTVCLYGFAMVVATLAHAGPVLASPLASAPEIDGGTLATAVGVLTAGVLVLRARFK